MKTPAAPKPPAKKKTARPAARSASSVERDEAESAGAAASSFAANDEQPGQEDIAALQAVVRAFLDQPEKARVRGFLERLRLAPPQVLLLEGGTADERLAAAWYWSLLLNCPVSTGETPVPPEQKTAPRLSGPVTGSLPLGPEAAPLPFGPETAPLPREQDGAPVPPEQEAASPPPFRAPCLVCPECVRLLTRQHRDCFFFDGLTGSIKIDDVRAMRAVLGEPAREARFRVVIFREAQSLVEAAANALLKSFEEPRPGTSFVLLAPQRERLLPTLVSRSLVLTLPWPRGEDQERKDRLAPWEAALCTFLRSGRDFFERSGVKGAVDATLVQELTGLCRRALARRLSALQSKEPPAEGLETLLAHLPAQRLRMLDEALAECQDSLLYTVNPTLVLEWLATRLYLLMPRRTGTGPRA